MQMTVVEKSPVEDNVSAEMDIVEVDDGLVEMLNRTKDDKPTKKKEEDVQEITIDSDSEEEDIAVVKADHL
jgi:hypothetical protein